MCQDNSVTFLQSLGYNVVRLPREGIDPLLLLNGGNNLNILGYISDIMLSIKMSRMTASFPLQSLGI
jgi:hypothetical protein